MIRRQDQAILQSTGDHLGNVGGFVAAVDPFVAIVEVPCCGLEKRARRRKNWEIGAIQGMIEENLRFVSFLHHYLLLHVDKWRMYLELTVEPKERI